MYIIDACLSLRQDSIIVGSIGLFLLTIICGYKQDIPGLVKTRFLFAYSSGAALHPYRDRHLSVQHSGVDKINMSNAQLLVFARYQSCLSKAMSDATLEHKTLAAGGWEGVLALKMSRLQSSLRLWRSGPGVPGVAAIFPVSRNQPATCLRLPHALAESAFWS